MTLQIHELHALRKVIAHDDADGIASAMIVRDVLPEVEVVFMQYGTPEHRDLKAEPGMLFVDFSPHPDRTGDFFDARSIVLDHHVHAKEVVEGFFDRGIFGENFRLECGAILAFLHVWVPLCGFSKAASCTDLDALEIRARVMHFARYTATRDCWDKTVAEPMWRMASAQAAALQFFPRDTFIGMCGGWRVPWMTDLEMQVGYVLYDNRVTAARELAAKAMPVENFSWAQGLGLGIGEIILLFHDPSGLSSDVAEAARELGIKADATCGFFFRADANGMKVVFSLRSLAPNVDVGGLAKHYGGGGHRGAAGFTMKVDPEALMSFLLEGGCEDEDRKS